MGQKWEGGDIVRYAGGGQKVNLLKDAMEEFKDKKELVVMFVDRSVNVMLSPQVYDITH